MSHTSSIKVLLVQALLLTFFACPGCSFSQSSSDKAQDDSPQLVACHMAASYDAASPETTQRVETALRTEEELEADGNIASDFTVLLNDEPVDGDLVMLDVSVQEKMVVFTFSPGPEAQGGPSSGRYFALYGGQFSISPARDDGVIPHLRSQKTGAPAVLSSTMSGTLPSGLQINVIEQIPGSVAENTPAMCLFEVTQQAQARVVTWISLDGGTTKLLKHNHQFALSDETACAADIVGTINRAHAGVTASSEGSVVSIVADKVVDGQVFDPVVVFGYGQTGGHYSPEGM